MCSKKSSRKSVVTHHTYTNLEDQLNEVSTGLKLPTNSAQIVCKKRAKSKNVPEKTCTKLKSDFFTSANHQPKSQEISSIKTTAQPEEIISGLEENGRNDEVIRTSQTGKTNWLSELGLKRKALQTSKCSPEKIRRNSEDSSEHINVEDIKDGDSSEKNEGGIRVVFIKDYKLKCRQSKEAFVYAGHKYSVTNGEINYKTEIGILATCKFCNQNYTYQNPSKGGTSNLTRHLTSAHVKEFDSIQKKIEIETVPKDAIMQSWLGSPMHMKKYSASDPIQKRFNNSLQYCIARDKLPLNLVNGKGFKKLISTLDPKINIPSRSTIQRRLTKDFETKRIIVVSYKVIPGLKKLLGSADKGIISLDGWKSRRKDSILGFKFHFIDNNWKLRKTTIAIKVLNEGQSGDDIKKCYDAVIADIGLMRKIGYVITDSGANMIKAFRTPQTIAPKKTTITISDENDCSSDEESVESEPISSADDIILYCESDSEDDETNDEIDIESSSILAEIMTEAFDKSDIHLRCTAHQLQLAINKALEDQDAKSFLGYINSVIHFFNTNTVYLAKLRKIAGKGLLRKATTRWNYWVDALNRVAEAPVYNAIKSLLEHAHLAFRGAKKNTLPRLITKVDLRKITEIVSILKPFAELTDELQGDGITASMLIPSIVTKLKNTNNSYTAVLRTTDARFFDNLKKEILSGVNTRFERIFRNPAYLYATALDPRTKLNVFKLLDTGGLNLPSFNEAKQICSDYFCAPVPILAEKPTEETSAGLNFLDAINQEVGHNSEASESILGRTEFEQYLAESVISSKEDVLKFWRSKESQFPSLAASAKLYLAIPATSGSVERLFSELSAIGRSHRASICGPQFEMLVMFTESES